MTTDEHCAVLEMPAGPKVLADSMAAVDLAWTVATCNGHASDRMSAADTFNPSLRDMDYERRLRALALEGGT